MSRINYLDTEHSKRVLAHSPNVMKLKTKSTNFLCRTQAKNQLIMRHLFDRLVETCGPYDGLGAAINYRKSGMPNKLKWGGPETPFDAHILAWELELVEHGVINREEILGMASIGMNIRWAITSQRATDLWRAGRIILNRRPAAQAGWLLMRDQIKLEELNFPHGHIFKEVAKEQTEDVEPDV